MFKLSPLETAYIPVLGGPESTLAVRAEFSSLVSFTIGDTRAVASVGDNDLRSIQKHEALTAKAAGTIERLTEKYNLSSWLNISDAYVSATELDGLSVAFGAFPRLDKGLVPLHFRVVSLYESGVDVEEVSQRMAGLVSIEQMYGFFGLGRVDDYVLPDWLKFGESDILPEEEVQKQDTEWFKAMNLSIDPKTQIIIVEN